MVLATAAGAGAQPETHGAEDYARTGLYLGLGATYTPQVFDLPSGIDATGSAGLGARVGYRLHPHVATELAFEYYDNFELDAGGVDFAEINGWTIGANAKGYPLTGRIQPYALLGLGALHLDAEDTLGLGVSDDATEFAARFGAGVDLYATRNLAVNVEVSYVLPTGDLDDFPVLPLTFGVKYRF
jgi:opacity protein-like surface antigen